MNAEVLPQSEQTYFSAAASGDLFTWTLFVPPFLKSFGMKKKERVTLEPELQAVAKHWGPIKRLEMAAMFARWTHQLRVSAFIMVRASDDPGPSFCARRARVRRGLQNPKANQN